MSHRIAYVVCPDCAGTGIGEMQDAGYRAQCIYCMGQRHVCVNLTPTGDIPDGYREWNGPKLGALIPNPLRLTYAQAPEAK